MRFYKRWTGRILSYKFMELIIQILILFILINCILKLSFWKPWQAALFGLLCAGFIVFSYPFAIQQSKTQLADYLNNPKILSDSAVLITIESAICFAFCFAALRELFGKKEKRWIKPLYWYPSMLVFPVLFYILTQSVFTLSGVNFYTIAYLLAGIVIIAFPLLSYFFKKLYPEKELRLEIHFLVSLFVAILGLITTVNGNVTYAAAETPLNVKALALSLGLFAGFFIAGLFWNKIKWRIKQKRNKGIPGS